MSDKEKIASEELPTDADQWRSYNHRKQTYDTVLEAWERGGCIGAPPPRPVPPHTPGFRAPDPQTLNQET